VQHNRLPSLVFHPLSGYIKILYSWIKNNPEFLPFSAFSADEVFAAVQKASAPLERVFSGKSNKLLEDLTKFSGFEWQESRIDIYPTFLFPSFSQPLNLRVVDVINHRLLIRDTDTTIRVLLHELGHRLVPSVIFSDLNSYEVAMDLLALKTLQSNGMAWGQIQGALSKVSAWPNVFTPTIRDYSELNGHSFEGYSPVT